MVMGIEEWVKLVCGWWLILWKVFMDGYGFNVYVMGD